MPRESLDEAFSFDPLNVLDKSSLRGIPKALGVE